MVQKFIKKAIKRPGALREKMNIKEGKTIPPARLSKTISGLQKKAEGKKKLTVAKNRLLHEALLARTLRGFKKAA